MFYLLLAALVPGVKIDGVWLNAEAAKDRGLVIREIVGERAERRVSLENCGAASVFPEELGWRKEGADDFDVEGLKVYLESWQMASPCGVRNWDDEPFDYSKGYLDHCVSTPSDFTPGEKGAFLSDHQCCLRRPDGQMRLYGFTTGRERFGHFRLRLGKDGVRELFALCACDRAELRPGAKIVSETFVTMDGAETEELFARFADRWAADSRARRRFEPPVGWCSWYYYFDKVTLADVIENAEWLKAHRADGFERVKVIQLDDGYQAALGDWLTPNAKFPGGLRRFADEIRARGFTPAVWVGPFMVEENSRLFAERPDWLVKGADGKPAVSFGWRDGHKVYSLDGTNPAVQEHLRTLFRTLRGYGIDYVKLDFCMLASSVRNARYFDATATRAQALRRAFEAIREGFGEDGFILGCTAPFGPLVGIVDAMRSSTDITPYWQGEGHQHAEAPTVPNVCRNIINHNYLNGRLWINDPDTLIVRDDATKLTQNEVELWAEAVLRVGGSLLLSDRFSTLSAARMPLVKRVLDGIGTYRGTFPADRWERSCPAVWQSTKDGRRTVARFDFDRAHTVACSGAKGYWFEEAGIRKYKVGRNAAASEAEARAAYDLPVGGRTWKIAPSMTLDEVNELDLRPGDKVLFARGGIWRGQLHPRSGKPGHPILYGACGEGEKPVIQPSYARSAPGDWRLAPGAGDGVWRAETGAAADIGNIIFEHGRRGCAFKRNRLGQVRRDLDFWCDPETFAVFLKSAANPAERFSSIELCEKVHCIDESKMHDVVYDGLALRYTAAHGIGGDGVRRITVRNCDISWIGGGYLYHDKLGNGVRYGNGIEFWSACEDVLVESNRVWECWDAGLTNQSSTDGAVQKNVVWRGNEVWNCEYSYEYWQQGERAETENVVVEGNRFRDAGCGWGHRQRWNPNAAHLMFYDTTAKTRGFVVENNVFSRSEDTLFRLFNDWRAQLTMRNNVWRSDGESICRFHGRPTANLVYRYPDRLDQIHDDNLAEIQSQGSGARVFGPEELDAFRAFIGDVRPAVKRPRIDAPSAFCVRRGESFSLPIAVAGEEPVQVTVVEAGRGQTKLPPGFAYDAAKGVLSGRSDNGWTHVLRITAANAAGRDEQLLTVRVSDSAPLGPRDEPLPVPQQGRFWTMSATHSVGGEHRLEDRSRERMTVWSKRLRSDDKFAETEVFVPVNRDLWTQTVMMFSCRSASGRLVRLVPLLEYVDRGRPTVLRGAPIGWRGSQWRNFQFPLNRLFALGDAGIRVTRIGFTVDIENWNPGETGNVEFKNVRLCKSGEVSFTGNVAEDRVTVVPSRPLHAFAARPDALKIYFAFDNEDLVPSICERDGTVDGQQDGGFRERLLEHLDGAATWTTNLAEAALVVYTRNRRDPALAGAIVEAVRWRGVPLLVASDVADPEIRAMLPVTLAERDPQGLAPRARIVAKDASAALADGLSTATFGIYRGCEARDGAKTLFGFADGTPAVVERMCGKGRVLYSMLGLGQTVVPGKRAYDAFFVRLARHLTGAALPEAAYDGCPYALGGGWYRGIGRNDFGRFGWEIGSGLLVESLGNTFRLSKGDDEYAFRASADRAVSLREMTFAPEDVSALSFGGRIAVNGRPFARFDASLAYPGTRWEFADGSVDLDVTGPLEHVAVRTKAGVKVVKAGEAELPPPSEWAAPWLCLFKAGAKASPLMVTFARRPDAVRVIVEDGCPTALTFVRRGGVGTVVTAWPFGAATCDTSAWPERGPDGEALGRLALWSSRAHCYPYALDEKFRLSADGRRFEIVDTYRYRTAESDWQVTARPYAAVPPMARFMTDMFATPDGVEPRLVTGWGDFADLDGAESVRWSLPVPEPDLSLVPHTLGFDKYSARVNDEFAHAVNFSCGGRTPLDDRTKEFPRGRRSAFCLNLDMHTMLLGMCRCLPNPYGYTPENRALMMRRARLRELEPLETAAYKLAVRYRREPFTDVPYTIYMHSWRSLITKYAPARLGSKTMYGDSNETVRMIAASLQMLADRHGQTGAVAANWETLRRFVDSYAMVQDDWLIMAAGCIEDCAVSSIDMLNTEYGTCCSLARLAEIAGDADMRTVYLFRAARRAVPTIARLRLKHYHGEHGLIADVAKVAYSTGFGEDGPSFRGREVPRVEDVDLFDMSQGIPQDLFALYARYAGSEIRDNYVPQLEAATTGTGLNYITATILATQGDVPEAQMLERLDRIMADKPFHDFLCSDWPGMDSASYLAYVFAKYRNTPTLTDCRDVDLHDAVYDPATKTLTLDVTPGERARLAVNGKALALGAAGVRTRLEVR